MLLILLKSNKYLISYNPKNLQNTLRTWTLINYMTMLYENLFKHGDNSSRGCVLEIEFESLEELQQCSYVSFR